MTYDPFATAAPAPAPAPEPAPAPATAPAATTVAAPRPDSESKVVVTLKSGTGYDAPWVVFHADSAEDAMAELSKDSVLELLDRVKKAGAYFAGGQAPAAPAQAQTSYQAPAQNYAAPAGATQPPASAPPKPFEDFVYKTGTSKKNGQVWHAWMPPQKGDPRQAVFFNA